MHNIGAVPPKILQAYKFNSYAVEDVDYISLAFGLLRITDNGKLYTMRPWEIQQKVGLLDCNRLILAGKCSPRHPIARSRAIGLSGSAHAEAADLQKCESSEIDLKYTHYSRSLLQVPTPMAAARCQPA
uniref:Uncharacterized protein n=1 Tax=Rhizophora mucronata TaxID=61149 RepID=A0A2P2JLM1_RHIMU